MDLRVLYKTSEEDTSPQSAQVTGTFPSWLNGNFVRVGPGRYELGDFKLKSWLDGMAILNSIVIDNNKVTIQRKFLQSDAAKKGLAAKKTLFTEYGTKGHADPSKNILSRMVNSIVPGDLTDNCNLNVYQLQGEYVAATETCFLRVFDPKTLETKDKVDLSKNPGINTTTCHPHFAPDGTMFNVGTSFTSGPLKYVVYKTPSGSSKGEKIAEATTTVTSMAPSWKTNYGYFHSFAMTQNYIIFVEQSLLVNTLKLLTSKAKGMSFKDCLDWTPEEKVKFIVIEKATGQRLKTQYLATPFYFLHHINAFEEADHIVIDLIAFENPGVMETFNMEHLTCGQSSNTEHPVPKRFVLPLESLLTATSSGNLVTLPNVTAKAEKQKEGVILCTPENIFELGNRGGFDLPRINYEKHNGRQYRYIYGTGLHGNTESKNSLCKGDIQTRKTTFWNAGDDFYCSEPVFVASPSAKDEDDGVVIAVVCSGKPDKQDYFVTLDAKTFKEIARAALPVRATIATHGSFIPKK